MGASVMTGASASVHLTHDYRVTAVKLDPLTRSWKVRLALCDEMQDAPLQTEVWAYDATPFVVGETVPVVFALSVRVASD